ncbi:neutral and basic amino acid transport protein rBAT-like [Crassostrea angulata]|uniref:neutral and basic amino acid transport protein rBAT-like n=1 Tax=Magallana angulata TaxID=2784310 RepID=UPI0022B0AF38|nr:neutral and basic amino acid transport protein rBAT-like [Crassostrea angulata]
MANINMKYLSNENELEKKIFINGREQQHVHLDLNETGLGKKGWKKLRLILLVGFLVGLASLIAGVVIILLAPKHPYRPDLKWYDKDTVYEILPESFKDSSFKNVYTKKGDGVGDLKGILARLDYLKDIGSKVLYINSIYESNGEDHKAIVNHTKIDEIYGSMEDFVELRKVTKEMKMRLIMDFIPNHTGKQSQWFLKSQKKEGKYTDYYIWTTCDPQTYRHDLMVIRRGAWTYDDTRKECYFHQLESDKPDLNLRSADVRQELESILRFWLDKGVDGFHVQDFQHLYEDKILGNGTLVNGKTDSEHKDLNRIRTSDNLNYPKLLKAWKTVLESYNTKPGREKALIVTAKDDLNTTTEYFDAGVTIVRVTPLSDSGASFAERIETKLKDANSKRIGWMYGDKYSSRLTNSLVGPVQIKALLTLQATLPGVPFNYYGNEIGMTDHPTLSTPNKYRTPMQWNSKGTGFSQNTPWVDRNANYITVNVETEKAIGDEYTTLKVYKRLQELRENESFQWGTMSVYRDGDLLIYTRKADGFPGYLVAINLGTSKVTESFHAATGIPKEVKVVFHTHKDDNSAISLSDTSYILDPSHAVVLEYQ